VSLDTRDPGLVHPSPPLPDHIDAPEDARELEHLAAVPEQLVPAELPTAPGDDELYAYLGPQHRWVLLVFTCAFALSSLSLFRFSRHSWTLYVFFAVLGLNTIAAVISLVSSQNRRKITREGHAAFVEHWQPRNGCPRVDVFLPTAGEDIRVLANTYRHVAALDYPGDVRVYVLDDGAREEVATLARHFRFDYLSRPDRGVMKKAGNLLFGFGRSDGDLVAIFDADFCPRPDYLRHTVPYFDHRYIGIVQTPQCFDTDASMRWLQRGAGATQELFYRWIQPSRDAVGAAICVGTNAIYRRTSLEAAGGFAQIEHSEDVHTGVAILSAGYKVQYLPVRLAKGLCPDDLGSFINQQYRWCSGSMSLLRSGEFHRLDITRRQKLCFWAGFLYYITTAINVFAVHIPGLVMEFAYPQDVRPSNLIPFLAMAWVWFVLMPLMWRCYWRFGVLRVQMVYSFAHAVAIWHTMRGRTVGWVPTGSSRRGSPLATKVAGTGVVFLAGSVIASWAGLVWDVSRYGITTFWLMGIFLAAYSYLAVPLTFSFARVLLARPAQQRVPARHVASAPRRTPREALALADSR